MDHNPNRRQNPWSIPSLSGYEANTFSFTTPQHHAHSQSYGSPANAPSIPQRHHTLHTPSPCPQRNSFASEPQYQSTNRTHQSNFAFKTNNLANEQQGRIFHHAQQSNHSSQITISASRQQPQNNYRPTHSIWTMPLGTGQHHQNIRQIRQPNPSSRGMSFATEQLRQTLYQTSISSDESSFSFATQDRVATRTPKKSSQEHKKAKVNGVDRVVANSSQEQLLTPPSTTRALQKNAHSKIDSNQDPVKTPERSIVNRMSRHSSLEQLPTPPSSTPGSKNRQPEVQKMNQSGKVCTSRVNTGGLDNKAPPQRIIPTSGSLVLQEVTPLTFNTAQQCSQALVTPGLIRNSRMRITLAPSAQITENRNIASVRNLESLIVAFEDEKQAKEGSIESNESISREVESWTKSADTVIKVWVSPFL